MKSLLKNRNNKSAYVSIFFRTSINWQIPALSLKECSIIIDFYKLITYTSYITYTYN